MLKSKIIPLSAILNFLYSPPEKDGCYTITFQCGNCGARLIGYIKKGEPAIGISIICGVCKCTSELE
jgi:hypothetical protein